MRTPSVPAQPKARTLIETYAKAERELRAIAEAAWERGAQGTAAYYARQHAEVVKLLSALQDETIPLITDLYTESYLRGVGEATAQMRGMGLHVRTDFAGVHTQAVNAALAARAAKANAVAESIGRRVPDALRKIGLEAAAQHTAQGRTIRDTAKHVRREMALRGMTEFRDAGGRSWSLTSYSRMVARTTTREAQTVGTATQLIANGLDLVTVSEHQGQCDLCAEFAGNTYSMTGDTPGFDVLEDYPPFHPNCAHVLTAARENLEAL